MSSPMSRDQTVGVLRKMIDKLKAAGESGEWTPETAEILDLAERIGDWMKQRKDAKSIVEHAIMMSGGGMHVRSDDPEVEEAYPLERWIPNQQKFGGKVYRRTIIVVEDWTEVSS